MARVGRRWRLGTRRVLEYQYGLRTGPDCSRVAVLERVAFLESPRWQSWTYRCCRLVDSTISCGEYTCRYGGHINGEDRAVTRVEVVAGRRRWPQIDCIRDPLGQSCGSHDLYTVQVCPPDERREGVKTSRWETWYAREGKEGPERVYEAPKPPARRYTSLQPR